MPITACNERWDERTRDTDDDGCVTLPRCWLVEVETDEAGEWPTLQEIEEAPEVEQYDSHPDWPRAIAKSCSVKPNGTPEAYLVTWVYDDKPFKGDGGVPVAQDPDSPTKKQNNNKTPAQLRPPTISLARKEEKYSPDVDRDGNPVVNDAGDKFEGLEVEKSIKQFTIKYFSVKLTTAHVEKYWDSINSDAFEGFSPTTIKCIDFQYEWVYENIGDFTALLLAVTLVVEHNPDGWGVSLLHQGRRESTDNGPRWIVDESGQPVSDPVPLAVGGARLATGDPVNYKTFHFKKAWPWTTIPPDPLAFPPVVGVQGILL